VNGQGAVAKARDRNPDLILLDFSMPVMNGLEARRMISASMLSVPMILYRLHSGKAMETVAKAAGFNALVSKNYDIDSLIIEARHLLGIRSAGHQS
jgi:CheY-like chemotaxis protein